MHPEPPTHPEEILIRPSIGLMNHSEGDSPVWAVPERRAGEEQEFEIAAGVRIMMCWIPPGDFLMGSPEDEVGRWESETQERLSLTQGFWLGKYPVTQAQWEAVMGSNPSRFKGSNLPVERVSFRKISNFSWKGGLPQGESFLEKINPFGEEIFALPTEAQWEYACRANMTTALNNGKNLTSVNGACPNLNEVGWYSENSDYTTHPVGQKKANAWGLHDMHGNVLEYCEGYYGDYMVGPQVNPRGPESYAAPALRGGCFGNSAQYCRAAVIDQRADIADHIGFRIARSSVFSCAQKYDDLEACVVYDRKLQRTTPNETSLINEPSIDLMSLSECESPALSEIISSRLDHIKTSNAIKVPERHAGEEQEFEIAPGVKIVMCWIPPGDFLMGSPEDEVGRNDDETQHRVVLTQGFWLGKCPVTQAQWEAVMGSNPCNFKGTDLPVQFIRWNDISEPGGFMDKVNFFASAEEIFSLPTEAQWEYACRAGTTTSLNNGKSLTSTDEACPNLNEVAWYYENSGEVMHPVGKKKANAWGLHDMHGNVWEWCVDWLGCYTEEPLIDPRGPDSGTFRVFRGGCWFNFALYCRAAYRAGNGPGGSYSHGIGFRVARSSVPLRVRQSDDVEACAAEDMNGSALDAMSGYMEMWNPKNF